MRRNYRAHLQSAAYLAVGVVAIFAGWAGPTGLPWWAAIGLEPALWWHLITLTAIGAAMVLKVQRPTTALVLGCVCVAADLSFGFSLGVLICLTDLIYNHGIRAPFRRVKVAERVMMATVVVLSVTVALAETPRAALNMLLLSVGVLMVPLWWAAEVRRGYPAFVEDRVRRRLEEERHAELLTEQKRRRASAVEAERRHMARELHDVVSSQVASIALTSAAVLNSQPEQARDRQALSTIRATSVNAMEELRHMVHVLRSQNAEDDAAAELLTETTWEQVITQARRQGLQVDIRGEPPEDLSPVGQAVLLRILQESLTNVLRHGNGPALVQLHRTRRQLVLTVESGAPCPVGASSVDGVSTEGTGTGILTMRERAQSLGGTLTAGEHRGQWRVKAELPHSQNTTVKGEA